MDYRTVAQPAQVIRERMDELQAEGISIAIADALSEEDLDRLGVALRDSLFLTAGSGLVITCHGIGVFLRQAARACLRRGDKGDPRR